jgi:hypothetical protein
VARRADDLPAEVLEEVMDGVPPGVHVYTRDGKIVDVKLDPQAFDGPDGVPPGWNDSPGDKAGDALAMLGAGVVLMGLSGLVTAGCVAVWYFSVR